MKMPRVSATIGSKTYQSPVSAQFASLRETATSDAAPASRVAPFTYDYAKGQITVASHHNGLTLSHGTTIITHTTVSRVSKAFSGICVRK